MFLPLYFKMDGLPCLMVGGGKVASRKSEMLLSAGCALTVVAPEIVKSIRAAVEAGTVIHKPRTFQDGDCLGFHLVIAATPHERVNRAVSDEACRLGIPVNVVDVPALCSVIFGAVWQEGPLTVSVSTGGVAPFMAAEVRDRIAGAAAGSGVWVEAAGRFREAVRAAIFDPSERDRLYRLFVEKSRTSPTGTFPRNHELAAWLAWLQQPGN